MTGRREKRLLPESHFHFELGAGSEAAAPYSRHRVRSRRHERIGRRKNLSDGDRVHDIRFNPRAQQSAELGRRE
jgi:hypothetical protein